MNLSRTKLRGLAAVLMAGGLLLSAMQAAGAVEDALQPWRFGPCRDAAMAKLVGLPLPAALRRVRPLHLMAIRILLPDALVSFESVPTRLTIVVSGDIVRRAFCR